MLIVIAAACTVQHGAHTCTAPQSVRGAFPIEDTNAEPVFDFRFAYLTKEDRSSSMALRPCRVLVPCHTASLAGCTATSPAASRA